MTYTEQIKSILEKSGVDTSALPDNLYSTLLNALLNAEMGGGGLTREEVEKIVTDEVSKIIADAPEDFDTLKEMSDWISQHEDSAAAMNSAIQQNATDISTLKNDSHTHTNKTVLDGITQVQLDKITTNETNISEIQDFLAVKTYDASCFVSSLQELTGREGMNLKESGYAWVFDLFITFINGVQANTKTKLGTVKPAPPRVLVKHNVAIMKNDNSGAITNDAIIKITTDGSLYITSPVAIRPTGTGEYGRIESNGTCIFEAIKL